MRYLPAGHRGEGAWGRLSWAEYLLAARQVAGGLAELGVVPGGRVGILSANRVEWHLADLGTLLNGSVTVPVYPTSSAAQIAHILGHCEATACFVDTHAQLGRLMEVRDRLPALKRLILAEGDRRAGDSFVLGFDALRAAGTNRLERHPEAVFERARNVRPGDLATIVYTSGASGPPKGAMLSHANLMWTLRNVTPVFDIREGERLLSFLPLSHIAERMMGEFLPIAVAGETWFARGLATVGEDLAMCRPTVLLAVPASGRSSARPWSGACRPRRSRFASLCRPMWAWDCARSPPNSPARPCPGPPWSCTGALTRPSGQRRARCSASTGRTCSCRRRRPLIPR